MLLLGIAAGGAADLEGMPVCCCLALARDVAGCCPQPELQEQLQDAVTGRSAGCCCVLQLLSGLQLPCRAVGLLSQAVQCNKGWQMLESSTAAGEGADCLQPIAATEEFAGCCSQAQLQEWLQNAAA